MARKIVSLLNTAMKFEFSPGQGRRKYYKAYYCYVLKWTSLDKGNHLGRNMLQYTISSSKSIRLV
jgi:hypothetical protein